MSFLIPDLFQYYRGNTQPTSSNILNGKHVFVGHNAHAGSWMLGKIAYLSIMNVLDYLCMPPIYVNVKCSLQARIIFRFSARDL